MTKRTYLNITLIITLCLLVIGCDNNSYSNIENGSTQSAKTDEVSYQWVLKPTIEADDIMALDGHGGTDSNQEQSDLCVIERDGNYGIIDYSGNILVKCIYPEFCLCICGCVYLANEDGLVTIDNAGNQIEVVHEHGREMGEEEKNIEGYENTIRYESLGIYAVQNNEGWGYINSDGSPIIKCQFSSLPYRTRKEVKEDVGTFSGNMVAVKNEKGCGYYDNKGKCVVTCGEFEEARPVQNYLAWVKQNGKWGVVRFDDWENVGEITYKHLPSEWDADAYENEKVVEEDEGVELAFEDIDKWESLWQYVHMETTMFLKIAPGI